MSIEHTTTSLTAAERRHLRNASHDRLSIAYEDLIGEGESLRSLLRRGLLRPTIAATAVITEVGREALKAMYTASQPDTFSPDSPVAASDTLAGIEHLDGTVNRPGAPALDAD